MPQRERVTWILFAIAEKDGCKHLHIVDRQKPASDFVHCIFAQVCISRGPNVHPQLPRAQHVNNYGHIAADDVLR